MVINPERLEDGLQSIDAAIDAAYDAGPLCVYVYIHTPLYMHMHIHIHIHIHTHTQLMIRRLHLYMLTNKEHRALDLCTKGVPAYLLLGC